MNKEFFAAILTIISTLIFTLIGTLLLTLCPKTVQESQICNLPSICSSNVQDANYCSCVLDKSNVCGPESCVCTEVNVPDGTNVCSGTSYEYGCPKIYLAFGGIFVILGFISLFLICSLPGFLYKQRMKKLNEIKAKVEKAHEITSTTSKNQPENPTTNNENITPYTIPIEESGSSEIEE